jgi:hypothetical protein
LFNATHVAVMSCNGVTGNELQLARAEFQGTAFPLSPQLFATALHVYRAAVANGPHVALGRVMTNSQQLDLVTDAEEFPLIDVAFLRCPAVDTPKLRFDFATLDYLSEIAAMGFPFGVTMLSEERGVLILRAFKGHVVTRRGLVELSALAPPGYETSFVPPPGLSGAPLISFDGKVAVRGIMLREHTAELGTDPERKMTLGIALDIEELLTLDSRLLGGSVAEKAFLRARIPNRDGTP